MNIVIRFFAGLLLATVFTSASAATGFYYDSQESCEAAWRAGSAVEYKPTAKHKNYGKPSHLAGLTLRPLEGDVCMEIHAQPGWRHAFFKEGTPVWVSGTDPKLLDECQNEVRNPKFLRKEEPQRVTRLKKGKVWDKPEPAPIVPASVNVRDIRDSYNTLIVNGDIIIGGGVQRAAEAPAVPAAAQSCTATGTCSRGFVFDRESARTDGRCVIAFEDDTKNVRFVRFDTAKSTDILFGAKVDDVRAEWNRNYDLVPMGRMINGVDHAIRIRNISQISKPCHTVLAEIKVPGVLDRTWKRLGLTERCRPVGVVGNPQQGSYVRTGTGWSDSASNFVAP